MRKRVAVAFVWLAVWQLASLAVASELLFPGPVDAVARLGALVADSGTWLILGVSALRVLVGFALAFALAVAFALVASAFGVVRELLEPPLSVLKSTPVACAIVLLLLWVGPARVATVIVFIVVFPAMYFSTLGALGQPNAKLDELLQVMRVPAWRRFCASAWPSIVPYVSATARNACGMAWKSCVAAEVIGMPALGVGERIYQAKLLLETADVFAWTILVIALSYVMERVVLGLLSASVSGSLKLAVAGLSAHGAQVDEKNVRPSLARCANLAASYRDCEGTVGGKVANGGAVGDESAGREPVFQGLNLEVAAGETIALCDESGAGKTTLIRVLAGLMEPDVGSVEGFSPASIVFQEARLVEGLSAVDNVMLCASAGVSRADATACLREVLADAKLDVAVSQLSGGQRRRVELVRALLAPSATLLLDEPFASLDQKSAKLAAKLVRKLAAERPVVIATHSAADIAELGARRVTLR